MAVGYYEFTIPNRSRFKDCCFYANDLVWAPGKNDGACDVIDPTTDTPLTPLALTVGPSHTVRNWRVGCLVDDRYIVLIGESTETVFGVIDTQAGSYAEHAVGARANRNAACGGGGHAWVFGSNGQVLKLHPVTGAWSETAVTVAGGYNSAVAFGGSVLAIGSQTQLIEVATATGTQTARTIAAAQNKARNAAAVSNAQVWATDSLSGTSTDRVLRVAPSSWGSDERTITGNSDLLTAVAPGMGHVWFPRSGGSGIGRVDDVTGVTSIETTTGGTTRTRRGAALVPSAPPMGKIYCPSDGHATMGVYTDIPIPVLSRGWFRGRPIG